MKLGFLVRIGTLGVDDSFKVGLENSMYKNRKYKLQTKKMILIPNIFFVGAKWFLHLIARSWENFRFLGGLISCFWRRRGRGLGHLLP